MTRAAPSRRALGNGQRAAAALCALLDAAEHRASSDGRWAAALTEPAAALHDALSSVLLRLSAIAQRSAHPAKLEDLASRAQGADALFAAAGLSSGAFRAPPRSPLSQPLALIEGLPVEARGALLGALYDASDVARDLGALHQELLEVSVERLEGASVRIAPSGLWVPLRALLEEGRATRSRRLQRLAGLPKGDVQRLADALGAATTEDELGGTLARELPRRVELRPAGALVVGAGLGRRSTGAHYTPRALAETTLRRALEPLLADRSSGGVLALRICDPAMGSGDFLAAAADVLASALERAWENEGQRHGAGAARAAVTAQCLSGVDRDPLAVDCARWTLGWMASSDGVRPLDLSHALRAGDALVGSATAQRHVTPSPPFHWHDEFSDVFAGGGFHACVGNPPWVAYAGRAAQPLAPELAAYYQATNPAFFGYRSLHGLFVRRAAELLCTGGRLGLVLPTSVADLHGYAPARAAHDALCESDDALTDFGDGAFAGVFQPCMALTSTRRGPGESPASRETWRLARTDLDPESLALLARLEALPRIDPAHFGERGLQSTGDDLSHLKRLTQPEGRFTLPLREGSDVAELAAAAPSLFADPAALASRLRTAAEYARVDVLIRQTARFPIAARSDGVAFRNSLLAGFGTPALSAAALLAYLNSSLVRFFHFSRHRDARQGMPQLKIGHLRALPALPSAACSVLDRLGRDLGERNSGVSSGERDTLDALVFDALHLSNAERAVVRDWVARNPTPKSRGRKH